jgi:hypothetical protein
MEMIFEKISAMTERLMDKMGDKETPKRKPRETQGRKVSTYITIPRINGRLDKLISSLPRS